jgi:uncharacterized protein
LPKETLKRVLSIGQPLLGLDGALLGLLSTSRAGMQVNIIARVAAASLTLGALPYSPAQAAEAEPTVAQIYQAFRSGHLEQAQQMLDRVLRDHPDSAKAHFVQAEIDAAEGHRDLARSELARAEKLKPGLPDVKPRSVQ